MKNLFALIILFPFFCFTQTLTINNNQTHTTSGDASYSSISLGNNGLLNVVGPDSIYCSGNVSSSNGIGITIGDGGVLHIDGTLSGNNNIQLNVSGKITIGSVDINNNGTLTILGSGEVSILGDLTAENGTDIEIDFDGTLSVGGNVTIDEATSSVNVNGSFIIDGSYNGPAFTGEGTVNEGGVLVYPATLPVEFLGMSVNCENGGYNTVTWETASETNSDYFILERSRDGIHWTEVSEIKAAGTSNKTKTYTYYDLQSGRYFEGYYQLTQIDYDGLFEIFDPISVRCETEEKYQISAYPNPTEGQVLITIYSLIESEVELKLTNMSGQNLKTENKMLEKGVNVFEFNLSEYGKGIYLMNVKDESSVQNISISKK